MTTVLTSSFTFFCLISDRLSLSLSMNTICLAQTQPWNFVMLFRCCNIPFYHIKNVCRHLPTILQKVYVQYVCCKACNGEGFLLLPLECCFVVVFFFFFHFEFHRHFTWSFWELLFMNNSTKNYPLTCIPMTLRGISSLCCLIAKCHERILMRSSNVNSNINLPSVITCWHSHIQQLQLPHRW